MTPSADPVECANGGEPKREDRDLPVLRTIVELAEEHDFGAVYVGEVEARMGCDHQTVEKAIRALYYVDEPFLVKLLEIVTGPAPRSPTSQCSRTDQGTARVGIRWHNEASDLSESTTAGWAPSPTSVPQSRRDGVSGTCRLQSNVDR
jgi:hypothetical protein